MRKCTVRVQRQRFRPQGWFNEAQIDMQPFESGFWGWWNYDVAIDDGADVLDPGLDSPSAACR